MDKITSSEQLSSLKNKIKNDNSYDCCLTICGGTGCQGSGAQKVINKLKKELKESSLEDSIDLKVTGCHGFCEQGPLMVIRPQDILYVKITEEDVSDIVQQTLINDNILEDLLYSGSDSEEKIKMDIDIPFYKNQERIVFEKNGFIDPESVKDYLLYDGYKALAKALNEMSPGEVIKEVKKANLRGRGGGGFPTGKKWEFTKKEESDIKYVICNADEGDPGAYMDRSLLEGNPHLIIEGMILGAYAIGATQGYIYVRTEYPMAVENTKKALEQAKELGLLGKNIMDSGFDFELEIMKGAGAFVAGEETALISSIEGQRGVSNQRPPFPAQEGLWGKPTNINNVETWANVPFIINNGADWFKNIGTEKSSGTKIFSLVGKINNTGLIEVPMGIKLSDIVFDIGGGIPDGKKFKAVQTGGPSGGCIPEDLLDIAVDYEKLVEAGSMMGSGGMVVMDEDTCMVDVSKYFLEFLQDESCGKCPPCRTGIPKMLEFLTNISEGKGSEEDLIQLEELAKTIKTTSLCGLGQSAPNPVLSTLRYFKDEYQAHIDDQTCPARVCPDLIHYLIIDEKCKACDRCKKVCPSGAIEGEVGEPPYLIVDKECIRCGACIDECPFAAIEKRAGQKDTGKGAL